jgi:hypothetical protein
MQPAKLLTPVISCLLLTTACTDSARRAYDSSADCAANELAWHTYVDQAKDPSHMAFADDRLRFVLLWRQVERTGKRLGLSASKMREDIQRRSATAAEQDGRTELSEAALHRRQRAIKCLATPLGSTGSNAASLRSDLESDRAIHAAPTANGSHSQPPS